MSSSKVAFDYLNYMTIEALDDEVKISYTRDSQYGINGIGWNKYMKGFNIIINRGQLISFKNNLNIGELNGQFDIVGKCNLRGNCLSMIFGDNAKDNKDISLYGSSLSILFASCEGIQSVDKNFLPATKLSPNCYKYMFSGCTSLVSAPELPATTLADYCYYQMFQGCTSLTTAPELPATTLYSDCYSGMFYGCTSLTTAPVLPATTLTNRCYMHMFWDCSKLNYIKMLATHIGLGYSGLQGWVRNVSSTGTFVKNPAMTALPTATSSNNYVGIPSGWTVQNA